MDHFIKYCSDHFFLSQPVVDHFRTTLENVFHSDF